MSSQDKFQEELRGKWATSGSRYRPRSHRITWTLMIPTGTVRWHPKKPKGYPKKIGQMYQPPKNERKSPKEGPFYKEFSSNNHQFQGDTWIFREVRLLWGPFLAMNSGWRSQWRCHRSPNISRIFLQHCPDFFLEIGGRWTISWSMQIFLCPFKNSGWKTTFLLKCSIFRRQVIFRFGRGTCLVQSDIFGDFRLPISKTYIDLYGGLWYYSKLRESEEISSPYCWTKSCTSCNVCNLATLWDEHCLPISFSDWTKKTGSYIVKKCCCRVKIHGYPPQEWLYHLLIRYSKYASP